MTGIHELDPNKLIYLDDNELAGFVNHNKGELILYVHHPWRRKGIGTKLLNAALRRWRIDLTKQVYTTNGERFIKAWMRSRYDARKRFTPNISHLRHAQP